MSYQVLARKWRPQNFEQMVGQEHVLQALVHALESQRLHHAYLFTGTRGVGKTTIGRILAKCLSCEQGIGPRPCGECQACSAITQGRYVDLIEIDAASRTKVEDMRELLDNVQYAPTQGKYKIYLIDEVHMLSTSSFNALLKTLEEPPEHVKFLFATTDPQKLPVTILSRCLQFNLKNMSPERIVQHLQFVLGEEGIQFEETALWALARSADGSMRDALSLTDQAIAYGQQVLTEQSVSAMLGTIDHKQIYRILAALVARDAKQMLEEVRLLAEFSPDYREVLASLVSLLHRIAVEQAVPGATDNSLGDQDQVVHYARSLSAEDVQLYYQIALTSRQDLSITPDPKAGLEMALLRMLAFQLQVPEQLGELSESAVAIPAPASAVSEPASAEAEVSTSSPSPSPDSQAVPTKQENTPHLPTQNSEPMPGNAPDAAPPTMDGPPLEAYGDAIAASVSDEESDIVEGAGKKKSGLIETEPTTETEVLADSDSVQSAIEAPGQNVSQNEWPMQASRVPVTGMTQNLLLNMAMERSQNVVKLFVDTGHYRLLNDSHRRRIVEAMQQSLDQGERCQIEFVEGLQAGHETPMMWRERRRAEMQSEARHIIMADPHVQQLIEAFDARVIEDSIEALGDLN
ncbi:MAG: DNA polymerase III subunit gamma/tau [Oleiphilaceae bacterium]|nr:DNA polymerase III subunit gamma/tau [Oleiphilaceae bacterium]